MGSLDKPSSKTHILAFPFPAKGHINPMLHFCNLLISKGLKVTMIYTASTMKSAKPKANNDSINTETISDGVTDSVIEDVEAYFRQFRDVASQGLTNIIEKHQMSNNPPVLVLYDSVMPWVLDVAQNLGLRGASFFTQSASVCAVYYHMLQGTVKKSIEENGEVTLPFMPPLASKDLPGFDYFLDIKVIVERLLLDQFSNIHKVDYILFNTFHKLEDEVVNWMASQWPAKTIGPTAPPMSQVKKLKNSKEDSRYLFETNAEACLKWLDSKEAGSVVYVSFGSIAKLMEEQMAEVALGIKNSNCNFLWVVRDEEDSKLAKSFKSETSDKGLIINWCPQLDVLAHQAVACFMTHCGWNSTLEGVSSGVPMIAVPQWVDQTTNAKFIADIWEAGVRVEVNDKGMVTREEIERCIREVTESERGMELKRNAIKWKKYAKEAVEEGGSSDRNVEEFVSSLV